MGKPRGAGGQEEKQRRQATHTCGPGCQELPIQSPGAPWVGVGGVAKEGERLQATSTPSAGLRGEAAGGPQSPGGPLRVGLGGSGASPRLEEAPSTTHRHAGEDGVSPRGTGALPGLTLERQEPLSGEGQDGGPLESAVWEAAQALGMERPVFTSGTCLLSTGQSVCSTTQNLGLLICKVGGQYQLHRLP